MTIRPVELCHVTAPPSPKPERDSICAYILHVHRALWRLRFSKTILGTNHRSQTKPVCGYTPSDRTPPFTFAWYGNEHHAQTEPQGGAHLSDWVLPRIKCLCTSSIHNGFKSFTIAAVLAATTKASTPYPTREMCRPSDAWGQLRYLGLGRSTSNRGFGM